MVSPWTSIPVSFDTADEMKPFSGMKNLTMLSDILKSLAAIWIILLSIAENKHTKCLTSKKKSRFFISINLLLCRTFTKSSSFWVNNSNWTGSRRRGVYCSFFGWLQVKELLVFLHEAEPPLYLETHLILKLFLP